MFRNIKPLFDRVLVERVQPVARSAGGILLPDSARSKLNEGIVRAVGSGARNRDGKEVAPVLKEGDKVLLPEFGGTVLKMKDEEYVIYREDDILAVVKE